MSDSAAQETANPLVYNRFKPGQSGNPAGVSKIKRELGELSTKHGAKLCKQSWERLEFYLTCGKAKWEFEAIKIIFDRVYGKPRQSAELKLDGSNMPPIVQILLQGQEQKKEVIDV